MALKDKLITLEDLKAVHDVDAEEISGLKADLDSLDESLQATFNNVEDIIGTKEEGYSATIYSPGVTAVTFGYFINSQGVETEETITPAWNITDHIAINPSSVLSYNKFFLTSNSVYSAFYDSNKEFVSSFKPINDGELHTLDVPVNAYYVRFSLKTSDAARFTARASGTFETMSLHDGVYISGENIADDLTALDNQLVNVSGYSPKDALFYKRTYNSSLFIPSKTTTTADKCINSSGEVIDDNVWNVTDFIEVVPSGVITYEKFYLTNSFVYSAFYNKEQEFLQAFKPYNDGGTHTLDVPSNAKYVRFSLKDSDLSRFTAKLTYRDYDQLEVPSYYMSNDYLDNKVARIREVIDSTGGNSDAFFFITDMHWLMNAQNSPSLIKYISERVNIPRIFDGGDRANGINKECNEIMRRCFSGKEYFCIGNHEYINGLVDYDGNVNKNYVANDGALYNEYNSCRDDVNTDHIERGYYYIDNKVQKIRYIVLASFQYGSGSAASGGYEDAQLSWFSSAVNGTPAGWHILVLTHFLVSTTLAAYRKRFTDVLTNYSGDAIIIGVVEGHTHYDNVYSSDDTGSTITDGIYHTSALPILAVTSDKNVPWYSPDDPSVSETYLEDRISGTIKEQAFDVIVVNKTDKVLHQIRIGCPIRDGKDPSAWTEMEERKLAFYNAQFTT